MVKPVSSTSLPGSNSHPADLFLRGAALFTVLFFSIALSASAQDTEIDCSAALPEAETAYFNGDFDRTLDLLQPCIDSNRYSTAEAQRAYTLSGRTHFVLGQIEEASAAIETLFTLNPEYSPPSQFPPDFIAFIASVKDNMTQRGLLETRPADPVNEPLPLPIAEAQDENEEGGNAEAQRRRRKSVFLLGGGAALAVGVTAAILLTGSDGKPPAGGDWPFPPGRP